MKRVLSIILLIGLFSCLNRSQVVDENKDQSTFDTNIVYNLKQDDELIKVQHIDLNLIKDYRFHYHINHHYILSNKNGVYNIEDSLSNEKNPDTILYLGNDKTLFKIDYSENNTLNILYFKGSDLYIKVLSNFPKLTNQEAVKYTYDIKSPHNVVSLYPDGITQFDKDKLIHYSTSNIDTLLKIDSLLPNRKYEKAFLHHRLNQSQCIVDFGILKGDDYYDLEYIFFDLEGMNFINISHILDKPCEFNSSPSLMNIVVDENYAFFNQYAYYGYDAEGHIIDDYYDAYVVNLYDSSEYYKSPTLGGKFHLLCTSYIIGKADGCIGYVTIDEKAYLLHFNFEKEFLSSLYDIMNNNLVDNLRLSKISRSNIILLQKSVLARNNYKFTNDLSSELIFSCFNIISGEQNQTESFSTLIKELSDHDKNNLTILNNYL